MSCRLFGVSIAVASCLAVLARAQAPHSTQLATELDSLLTARSLDAIAAADPEEPNRFVAALSYPKSQLLVVDALYPAPALLRQEIVDAKYRDVYLSLQQSGTPDSRLFFLDLGYDGLHGSSDAVDVLYEGATKQTLFDGQPGKAQTDEEGVRDGVRDRGSHVQSFADRPDQSTEANWHAVATMARTSQDIDAARALYTRISSIDDTVSDRAERRVRALGLSLLEARSGERILEIGFGTGSSLVALAESVGASGHVFGIDISAWNEGRRRGAHPLGEPGRKDQSHARCYSSVPVYRRHTRRGVHGVHARAVSGRHDSDCPQ
jgi:hypothetical protein